MFTHTRPETVTAPELKREIKGCPSVGGRAAVRAKYANAQYKKFAEVIPCIFETFGGFEHEVVELLNDWAARARQKTPEGQEPKASPQLRPVLVADPQHHGPARRRGGDPQPRARGDGSAQRDACAVGLRPAALV